MEEGKRPGGLTALAVINFVFSGLGLLSILGMVAMLAVVSKMPTDDMDENTRAQIDAMKELGTPIFIGLMAVSAISSVMLLLAGIGYIKQKKVLGRYLGNAYALVAIISGVASALMLKPEIGGGFNIGSIIGFIYPFLTLFLINTTFKEDLVN